MSDWIEKNGEKSMSSEKTTNAAPVHGIVVTPGPWFVELRNCSIGCCGDMGHINAQYDGDTKPGRRIAVVDGGNAVWLREGESEGNRTAIAAVPDLLELVARAYLALHRGQWEDGETDAELCERINDTMCSHFGNNWCA